MPTTMHRLQVSLPEWQVQFLAEVAQQKGVSMAEVVRGLVDREAEEASSRKSTDSIWEIAGIAEDDGPLVEGVPVSENPELYLTASAGRPARGRDVQSKAGSKK